MRGAVSLLAAAVTTTACHVVGAPILTLPPTTETTQAPTCTNASVVASWPLARRAGALIAVPVVDFGLAAVTPAVRAGAGGVLLLGRATAPADLASKLAVLRAASPTMHLPLVMADEEGGGISRLAGVVDPVPWARTMAATQTPAQVRTIGTRVGEQMRRAGVDVDLAPVLDVDAGIGPNDVDADGRRSFSGNAATASAYGVAFMNGLRAGGVLPVVKHFPGLGGTVGNTDVQPGATPSIDVLRRVGLVPFEAAITAGAPAVMVANASVPGVTPLPASLSHAVITGLLRGTLGFHGLVMTDSLSAGAIRQVTTSIADAAVRAVKAGADMVMFGASVRTAGTVVATFERIVRALVAAIGRGTLSVHALDASVLRVLAAERVGLC